jgi:hypothetical protein
VLVRVEAEVQEQGEHFGLIVANRDGEQAGGRNVQAPGGVVDERAFGVATADPIRLAERDGGEGAEAGAGREEHLGAGAELRDGGLGGGPFERRPSRGFRFGRRRPSLLLLRDDGGDLGVAALVGKGVGGGGIAIRPECRRGHWRRSA